MGQLGLGSTNSTIGTATGEDGNHLPAVDVGIGGNTIDICCGMYHTCIVLLDGGVKCWGQNNHGQLGHDRFEGSQGIVGTSTDDMGAELPRLEFRYGRNVHS